MKNTGTQRDKLIDELKRTDALLKHDIHHDESVKAEWLREKLLQPSERI